MLTLLASGLTLLGVVLLVVGALAFIVAAFRESVLWGLGVLFLPLVSLIFLVLHWQRAKDPFFLKLYGIGALMLAMMLSGGGAWPLG